jgi:protein TonB
MKQNLSTTAEQKQAVEPDFWIEMEVRDKAAELPVLTLVLWVTCLFVGVLGGVFSYARPQPPAKISEPVKMQMLQADLKNTPLPPPETLPPPSLNMPPPPDEVALPLVAQPSPTIAFALPVEGPGRVVSAGQAGYRRPETPPAVVPQILTFGQGEGKQPAPEYPPQALREGEEGTVVVRLTVAENGQVTSAEAFKPCAWPLLNQSALRTVRQRWRFPAGPLRLYDVTIRFQLAQ